MERTMFLAYCHAANLLAFLKDSSPDYSSLLAQLRGAVKNRNFRPERHWEETPPDSVTDCRPASEDEIASLRASFVGRDAEDVTVLSRLEQRHLTYRPKGKCPWLFYKDDIANPTRAGRLLKLLRFKRDGRHCTAALVESYVELTHEEAQQGDHYRKWEFLAGRLYNVDATPPIFIPTGAILHHAIHRQYQSEELRKMVRHLMPLSKVSNSRATKSLL
jgi:hypothetical protein